MGYARNSPLRVLENDSFTAQGSRKPHPLLLIAAIFFLSVYSVGSLYITLLGISGQPISGRATPILTVTAFLFAVIHAWGRMGWKRALVLLVLSTGISLVFESLGVATGLVYGAYHYTGQLGPKVLGLVPFLIPVAWFMMMYPSLLMAAYMQPASRQKSWKILSVAAAGALIMTAWDTVMDPMMSKLDIGSGKQMVRILGFPFRTTGVGG